MNLFNKGSNKVNPTTDELHTLIDICANCINDYGRFYLGIARAKANKSLLRRGTLPYYFFISSKLAAQAVRLKSIDRASGSKEKISLLSSSLETLPLSTKRKREFLEKLVQDIASKDPNLLVIINDHLVHLIGSATFTREYSAMQILQAQKNVYGALAKGREILAQGELSQTEIKKILKEPAMLLGSLDLVPDASVRQLNAVEGLICYVAASSLPYSVTGYTTRTEGVALGYSKLGFDVRVVTKPPFHLDFDPKLKNVPETEFFNGVEYQRLFAPLQKGIAPPNYIEVTATALEKRFRYLEPEIIIAASNHMNALPALIAARRLGLPFIYEVRGFWELSHVAREPAYGDSAHFLISQQIEAFVAKEADKVLTLTEQMRADLISRGVEADKIALMPNGVAEAMVSTPPYDLQLANSLSFSKDIPVIGYIGSILEYEGLQDLGRACTILAKKEIKFKLLIVGAEKLDASGSTPILDEIRNAFRENGIIDRLILPGRVPFSEVPRYYSLIDIAPIPRRPYAVAELVSPIKPLEAMAMAKAVLVSDVAALRDLVIEGETGLIFRKGDPADLAEKLEELLVDTELRSKIQKGGQKFVLENRTWPAICRIAAEQISLRVSVKIEEQN